MGLVRQLLPDIKKQSQLWFIQWSFFQLPLTNRWVIFDGWGDVQDFCCAWCLCLEWYKTSITPIAIQDLKNGGQDGEAEVIFAPQIQTLLLTKTMSVEISFWQGGRHGDSHMSPSCIFALITNLSRRKQNKTEVRPKVLYISRSQEVTLHVHLDRSRCLGEGSFFEIYKHQSLLLTLAKNCDRFRLHEKRDKLFESVILWFNANCQTTNCGDGDWAWNKSLGAFLKKTTEDNIELTNCSEEHKMFQNSITMNIDHGISVMNMHNVLLTFELV